MNLKDCTKSELIWVIEQAERHSFSDISHYIEMALDDLRYKREIDRIEKAKEQAEISRKASTEYVEILKPYEGQKIIDIPIEVLKKAEVALKRSKNANQKWANLMGIKKED